MEVIDLSQTISEKTPVYPGDEPIKLKKTTEVETEGYNKFTLITEMHAGTHLDCPLHFLNNQKTANEYDIGDFVWEGVLIDCRNESVIEFKPEYADKIKENICVVIYTGFSDFYFDSEKYFREHPVISNELAEFLVEKKVKAIATDIPSPDRPPYYEIHKLLLASGIFIVENLMNISELHKKAIDNDGLSFYLHAAPLKICAEASPVRAYAVINA